MKLSTKYYYLTFIGIFAGFFSMGIASTQSSSMFLFLFYLIAGCVLLFLSGLSYGCYGQVKKFELEEEEEDGH